MRAYMDYDRFNKLFRDDVKILSRIHTHPVHRETDPSRGDINLSFAYPFPEGVVCPTGIFKYRRTYTTGGLTSLTPTRKRIEDESGWLEWIPKKEHLTIKEK